MALQARGLPPAALLTAWALAAPANPVRRSGWAPPARAGPGQRHTPAPLLSGSAATHACGKGWGSPGCGALASPPNLTFRASVGSSSCTAACSVSGSLAAAAAGARRRRHTGCLSPSSLGQARLAKGRQRLGRELMPCTRQQKAMPQPAVPHPANMLGQGTALQLGCGEGMRVGPP